MELAELMQRLEHNVLAFRRAQAEGVSQVLRHGEVPGAEAFSLAGDPDRPWYHVAMPAPGGLPRALPALEAFFTDHGARAWRVVVDGKDAAAVRLLRGRGYLPEETTWAMGRTLEGERLAEPGPEVVPAPGPDALTPLNDATYGPTSRMVRDMVRGMPLAHVHTRILVETGAPLSGGFTFDTGDTAGIYNVVTVPDARGRGLAPRVVQGLLAAAQGRGVRAAVLQSSAMAVELYRRLGFRDLGTHVHFVRRRSG